MNRTVALIILIVGIIFLLINPILGVILAIIGAILLYRETNPKKSIKYAEEKLKEKENELKLMEEQKTKEIETELADKKKELSEMDEKIKKLEEEKEKELDDKLKIKKEKLDGLDKKFEDLEKEKNIQLDLKLKNKQYELDNIEKAFKQKEKIENKKLDLKLKDKQKELDDKTKKLEELQNEIIHVEDELNLQSYGLYEPKYKFIDSISYKERLDEVRKEQKLMIKEKTAAVATKVLHVDGSKSKGNAFTNANIKQILRTFNLESEIIIGKVKHSNLENSKKRLQKSFDQLNRLYQREAVKITQHYFNLKLDEMYIAYEYELKKQEEKELLHEAREKEKEEKRIQKELEKEKKKFDKENVKIEKEIEEVKQKLTAAANEEKAKLEAEIKKLQEALNNNNAEIKKINEWKETPGAGYVYIISNIGSFGEGVFKIGVTRRDNPEERIRELSSASVPFRYDTHVFIFSKDAYELEKELHERFDKQRVNKINRRKEFFKITIDDVKQIVEENKGAVHSFVEKPDAAEYYDTLKIEKQLTS